MAISKIILNGTTQIDLTQDTVAASNLISPNTAHGADGEPVVGTATSGGSVTVTDETNTTGTTCVITTGQSPTPTPSGTWETIYEEDVWVEAADGGFDLHSHNNSIPAPLFGANETWRVTITIGANNNTYTCETNLYSDYYYIGNINIYQDTYDGTGVPFFMRAFSWGTPGLLRPKPQEDGFVIMKLEKLVTT